jgi:hypothetical protein
MRCKKFIKLKFLCKFNRHIGTKYDMKISFKQVKIELLLINWLIIVTIVVVY